MFYGFVMHGRIKRTIVAIIILHTLTKNGKYYIAVFVEDYIISTSDIFINSTLTLQCNY